MSPTRITSQTNGFLGYFASNVSWYRFPPTSISILARCIVVGRYEAIASPFSSNDNFVRKMCTFNSILYMKNTSSRSLCLCHQLSTWTSFMDSVHRKKKCYNGKIAFLIFEYFHREEFMDHIYWINNIISYRSHDLLRMVDDPFLLLHPGMGNMIWSFIAVQQCADSRVCEMRVTCMHHQKVHPDIAWLKLSHMQGDWVFPKKIWFEDRFYG